MPMHKSYRQGQILKLIRARRVHTQEDLARALRTAGIQATQVTLSRDIHELGLLKTQDGYAEGASQAVPALPDVATLVRDSVLDVLLAQNLLVLRTPPGHANAVAVALDKANWSEVTGTIAGDDTVLIVAPDSKTAEALRGKLLKFLQ
jgi:transcriptional regulator of arginine metabolism